MLDFAPVKPIRGGRPLDELYLQLAEDPEWVCQAKLNGIRAIWTGKTLWSRTGNLITQKLAPVSLDRVRGVTHRLDGELLSDGRYLVFDLPDDKGPLTDRWSRLVDLGIPLCPTNVVWARVVEHGWEGVVFKKLASKYPKALADGKTTPSWVKYRAEWL